MKRNLTLVAALLLVAGSALAQPLPVLFPGGAPYDPNPLAGPSATGNMDTCDIAVVPAATLLLPYFEVNFRQTNRAEAVDTLITITNVSDVPAVAHFTVWSDWSYPVLDFNVFLTGYDVQGISLYDVIARGNLPSTGAFAALSPIGVRSNVAPCPAPAGIDPRNCDPLTNLPTASGFPANPNFSSTILDADECGVNQGGNGVIGSFLLSQIQSGLTGGNYGAGAFFCRAISSPHTNAVGYVTVDVANTCSQSLPIDSTYYTSEILFDNQLIGDYIRVNPSSSLGGLSGGNPLVHIRAIPPGGPAGATVAPFMPTFYRRYSRTAGFANGFDRRQPLPALFAARYIEGTSGGFDTDFAVWREGYLNGPQTLSCATSSAGGNVPIIFNSSIFLTETVRFDERENPTVTGGGCVISPCPEGEGLPETSLVNIDDGDIIPTDPSADAGGWVYWNLNNEGFGDLYRRCAGVRCANEPSQNWVTVRMTAETRYAVDFDAAYLGNGCTFPVDETTLGRTGAPKIGPQYGHLGQGFRQ